MEKWEYFTTFLTAAMEGVDILSEALIPADRHPKFSPYALIPQLNRLGEKGWELIHMEPVVVGRNHDVMVHPTNMEYWSSTYFCVFKRRA